MIPAIAIACVALLAGVVLGVWLAVLTFERRAALAPTVAPPPPPAARWWEAEDAAEELCNVPHPGGLPS